MYRSGHSVPMINAGCGAVQQRPHHAAGQPVLAVQVALQLIQPHHRPQRRCGHQRGDLVRPGRKHWPPVRQQRSDRFYGAPGLAYRGPADQQHEPALLFGGRHLGPDTGPGGIGIPRHVLRQDFVGCSRQADRRVDAQPPRVGFAHPHHPGRARLPGAPGGASRIGQRCRRGEGGQLVGNHGGELPRFPGPQVDRDHVRRQPGKGRVIEPGRKYVFPPFPHRPGQRGPALQPGPLPGGVLGGHEHHDRRCLLAIDDRQFIGQVLPPQLGLLIGVVEAAHPPRLQRLGNLPDVVPLRAGERQRDIPLPLRPGARARAAVRARHVIESPTERRRWSRLTTLSVTVRKSIDFGTWPLPRCAAVVAHVAA